MTKINNIQFYRNNNFLHKGKNIVKNLANYTYNIIPRTKSAIANGNQAGLERATTKNQGKFGTFFTKKYYTCKSVINSLNLYELPLLASTIALPITPPGGQPVVFVAGCILISPLVLKDILLKKTTVKDMTGYLKHLSEPDFIKLNKKVYKND